MEEESHEKRLKTKLTVDYKIGLKPLLRLFFGRAESPTHSRG
jgi:hypothetical protein